MGFLDRLGLGGGDDGGAGDDAARRRDEDVARIERGSVPLAAQERIRELAAGGAAFTSGLSVADFALTRLEQIRPVCQVMGSSVYQVGWQSFPWGSGWSADSTATELRQLTEAWNDARSRALGRLAEEASLAGSHAVVDVTFEGRRHDFLDDEIEIVVNGTAVHLPEGLEADRPVLTDLSLPDYALLRRAGYRPVGVVTATSVFYIVPSRQTRSATTGWGQWQNQELKDFTQGVYYAREVAVGRATSDARTLGAGGLVGVSIDEDIAVREVGGENNRRKDLIVTFHVVGTAIAPEPEHRPLDPSLMIRLQKRPT
ncbi:MAG: heavy metal-binding domain-containing protein [Solirubrobacteraceae bacterium]